LHFICLVLRFTKKILINFILVVNRGTAVVHFFYITEIRPFFTETEQLTNRKIIPRKINCNYSKNIRDTSIEKKKIRL